MTDKNPDTDLDTGAKEIEALYAQSAQGMAYDDGLLTLQGIAPSTIIFSDRPDRVTGHQPTQEFYDSWDEGDDSFADNSPNAVLSIFTEDEIHDVVVVLSEPALGWGSDELQRRHPGWRDAGQRWPQFALHRHDRSPHESCICRRMSSPGSRHGRRRGSRI